MEHKTLPKSEHEELVRKVEKPTPEEVAKYAELVEHKTLSKLEYEELVRKVEKPTPEEVAQYAELVEHKTLPKSEFEKLIKNDALSIDGLKVLCQKYGYTCVSIEEYDQMRSVYEDPSAEFLAAKALEKQLVLVSANDHTQSKESTKLESNAVIEEREKVAQTEKTSEKNKDPASPESDSIRDKIQNKGHVLIDTETFNNIKSSHPERISKQELIDLCSKLNLVPLPDAHYAELRNPSIERIKELAQSEGLVAIDRTELDAITIQAENPSEDSIIAMAPKYGYKVIRATEFENLQNEARKLSSPSKADVEKLAARLNLVVLAEESYGNLLEELKKASIATSISPTSKVAASKLYFENVIKKENGIGNEVMLESGKSLGFVRLSNDEYKKLLENQQKHELTKSDIYNGAKMFDLRVLPVEEYKSLLQRKSTKDNITYDDLQIYASRFALKLVPVDFTLPKEQTSINPQTSKEKSAYELRANHSRNISTTSFSSTESSESYYYEAEEPNNSLILKKLASKSSMASNSTHYTDARDYSEIEGDDVSIAPTIKDDGPTLEDLKRHAEVFGYVLVQKGAEHQVDSVVDDKSVSNTLSRDDIYSAAPRFGLTVLPLDEFREIEKNAKSFKELTPENIKSAADKFGLVILASSEHHKLLKNSTIQPTPEITKDNIEQKSREFGFVPVKTNDFLKLIKPDSIEDITEKASKLGMVTLTEEEYSSMTKPISQEVLESRAKELDLVTLSSLEYATLTKPLTLTDIKDKCEEYGYVAVTKEIYEDLSNKYDETSISRWAKENDKAIISKEEYDALLDLEDQKASTMMTKEELVEKAHELNMIPIDADKFDEIQRELASSGLHNMTEDDIMLKAKDFGLVTVPASESVDNLKQSLNKDDLTVLAHDMGLVPIPIEQFEQIKMELESPTLTREQIVDHAAEFDLIAIDIMEYKRLKKGSYLMDNDEEFDSDDEDEEDEMELVDSEIKHLNKTAKRFGLLCIPESAFVATSNANTPDVHNVVVLPIKYYNTLLHQESENWAKVTDERLQAEAKKRGFQIGVNLRKDFGEMPTYDHRRTSSTSTRSMISEDARKSMSQAASTAAMAELENQGRSRAPSRASSIRRAPPSIQTNHASVMTNSESIGTGLSLATMASLNAPSIIPALTQTMIGEYLHKYYRSLTSISHPSRHERYFWIHPYTLTLYWSSSNPVLENPGSNRTRAAAIMGVESVDDSNPYPAGLYQKSIVVKTEGRDIKFTCPTRQRHNIWFNSLRYLLQRNLNGISLDDMLQDEGNAEPNPIYQQPGETPQSAIRRLSSTRRASSSSNIRQSSSKWSLRAT